MALVLADRVQQTGTANTTVSFTLSGSVTGFQSFAVIGNTNTTYYSAFDTAGNWETGLGTYSTTGPTLTRTTIYQSSNSNAAVTFSGSVNVFVTYPAGRSVNQDAAGLVTVATFAATTSVTTPIVQATNSGGLSLKNSAGTTQISMGGGGGDNVSVNVSTNLNGTNAQIDISPTGTGHVHINPSGSGSVEIAPTNAGTMDNMTIGGTTPKAVTGTVIRASNGLVVNSNTVSANYTIASGDSASSVGPMTVASGVAVTVSSGSRWVVL